MAIYWSIKHTWEISNFNTKKSSLKCSRSKAYISSFTIFNAFLHLTLYLPDSGSEDGALLSASGSKTIKWQNFICEFCWCFSNCDRNGMATAMRMPHLKKTKSFKSNRIINRYDLETGTHMNEIAYRAPILVMVLMLALLNFYWPMFCWPIAPMVVLVSVWAGNSGMWHSICVAAIPDRPMMCHSPRPQFQFHFYLSIFANGCGSRATVVSLNIAINPDLLIWLAILQFAITNQKRMKERKEKKQFIA